MSNTYCIVRKNKHNTSRYKSFKYFKIQVKIHWNNLEVDNEIRYIYIKYKSFNDFILIYL